MSPIKLGRAAPPAPASPPPDRPWAPAPVAGAPQAGESPTGELRGYAIESDGRPRIMAKKTKSGESQGVSPVILFAAAGAFLVLLLVIVVGPYRSGTDAAASENSELVASYQAYLKQQKPVPADMEARIEEVRKRLEAIAWAERVGRNDVVRRELDLLLMLDMDRNSPVYRFASRRLAGT